MKEVHLYRFFWDYGSGGCLEGLFVATEATINNAIGRKVDFGRILGNHKDFYGELSGNDLEQIDVASSTVKEISLHLGESWSGYNPLEFIETLCDECGNLERFDRWNCEWRDEFDRVLCIDCYNSLQQ